MGLDKNTLAVLALVVAVAGGAITYIINYEGRLSRLETQFGFVMGVQSAAPTNTSNSAAAETSHIVTGGTVSRAVDEQCGALMSQYSDIVGSAALGLYNAEKGKLDALSSLIDKIGCGARAGL